MATISRNGDCPYRRPWLAFEAAVRTMAATNPSRPSAEDAES